MLHSLAFILSFCQPRCVRRQLQERPYGKLTFKAAGESECGSTILVFFPSCLHHSLTHTDTNTQLWAENNYSCTGKMMESLYEEISVSFVEMVGGENKGFDYYSVRITQQNTCMTLEPITLPKNGVECHILYIILTKCPSFLLAGSILWSEPQIKKNDCSKEWNSCRNRVVSCCNIQWLITCKPSQHSIMFSIQHRHHSTWFKDKKALYPVCWTPY